MMHRRKLLGLFAIAPMAISSLKFSTATNCDLRKTLPEIRCAYGFIGRSVYVGLHPEIIKDIEDV